MTNIKLIRNFSIIAHIDHGKSTLSDRIIEICGGLEQREMTAQILDSMDIEKERGITIKSQTVRLNFKSTDGNTYILNLMDTPGHVDFSYEVSRCLAACEGSVLLVDATQGVEAQTLANSYKAIDANNIIIPVLNKADLASAEPQRVAKQIEDVIGLDTKDIIFVSGKTGYGVNDMLEYLVKHIPHPLGDTANLSKALLIDAWYDQYMGVILLVRIFDGVFKKGDKIKMLSTETEYQIEEIGFFTPKKLPINEIQAGEVGYICANIKNVQDCNVGDTIILTKDIGKINQLPGFKKIKPAVFCGLYPVDASDYQKMKDSLQKLALNDSSITYEHETSAALGLGFRCGFLGLLHMEIIHERLEREFDLDLVTTAPSVVYKIYLQNGEVKDIHNPADMIDPNYIKYIEEPIAEVNILTTDEYVGDLIKLCLEKRGKQKSLNFSGNRVVMLYHLPLGEIVFDFHDRLKSISRGYASFEWTISHYEESDIVKVNILLNSDQMDALSMMTHRSKAEHRGRALCEKLKELIPRQMFAIPVQAAIGGKIIARETISAFRKDVTAKCYGGDVTRKKKLLEKQKKGKRKMKVIGSVEVPQSAFLAILKVD